MFWWCDFLVVRVWVVRVFGWCVCLVGSLLVGSVMVDGFVVVSFCWWRVFFFGGELLGGAVWGGQFCWRVVLLEASCWVGRLGWAVFWVARFFWWVVCWWVVCWRVVFFSGRGVVG